MTELSTAPFYKSYLLGRTISLADIAELPLRDLDMLNVDTLAALNEARHRYELIENKQSDEAGGEYRRIKVAGYFQAAIQIELGSR